ncbi:MAG: ABC transporter substrate-binding protein [Clostridia bacterium]|nr:ABC transporter substrate-binding protein [Clostridia bacterium]
MNKKVIIGIIITIVILILAIAVSISGNEPVNNIVENNTIGEVQNPEEPQNLRTINVSEVTRSVFYSPQYVAIEKGFFKENGIEIELITGQGADAVMTSVLSNQVEIGFAGPEASIYVYNEGKEDHTQVFAQLTKRDGSFLVSRNDTEEFSWQDLKGKTVIPGRKGGVPYMTLEYVLKKNGLDPQKDVVLDDSIKFDLMAGAFAAGNADYVTLFEPTASMTELQGAGYVVASVGEESGEIPYTAYFAKQSFIKENEDVIQGFTNAIYEGEQWVKNHTSREIAEVVQNFFPDTDLDMLEAAIQSYKDIDAWNETPILEEDSFNRLQEVMIEAGELSEKVPYSEIVNNTYAEKAINK